MCYKELRKVKMIERISGWDCSWTSNDKYISGERFIWFRCLGVFLFFLLISKPIQNTVRLTSFLFLRKADSETVLASTWNCRLDENVFLSTLCFIWHQDMITIQVSVCTKTTSSPMCCIGELVVQIGKQHVFYLKPSRFSSPVSAVIAQADAFNSILVTTNHSKSCLKPLYIVG